MTKSAPLTTETVLAIHAASLARFGGLEGIRDEGLLASALAQPFHTFGDDELYSTDAQKAARYAYGIISNHPFVDGNKRTATAVMGTFLRKAGHRFKPHHKDLLATIMGVAAGDISYEELVHWIESQLEDELDLKVWEEAKAEFEADPQTISAADIAKKYLS